MQQWFYVNDSGSNKEDENTHPLTYIADDIKDARIITPALLATGKDPDSPTDNPIKKLRV